MDAENKTLDSLLEKTDVAFKALLTDPDSERLNHAYEEAKTELEEFLVDMRQSLRDRYRSHR